jgi:hypothetical protein
MTPEERFFAKVEPDPKTGCWLWRGALTRSGHGWFHIPSPKGWNEATLAHRVSYAFACGIPLEELASIPVLNHLCNVKACVRPDHLEETTLRGNAQAAWRDGLMAVGERNGQAKLTEGEVKTILLLYETGWTQRRLGARYGVSGSAIAQIVQGHNWRHVR